MRSEQLKQRTKVFALRVMRLVSAMPKTIEGRALAQQLVKSGTSVGANYRACCRARSKAEFIAKLCIVIEEADETAWWLELIVESGMKRRELIEPLLDEANQLTAIFNSARFTARGGSRINKSTNQQIKPASRQS